MASKLNSISAKDISGAVRAAVKKSAALKEIKATQPSIANIRPPIMGFILRDADVKNVSMSELTKVASSVAKSLSSGKATPATFAHGGHIIIGFVEDASFSVFKE